MIELGPGADLLPLIGTFFWLLVAAALLGALILPKSVPGKVVAVAVVVGLFVAYPGRWAWERKQGIDAFKVQQAKALAHFESRCEKAGVFVHRTVDGVEGLFVGEIPKDDSISVSGNRNAENIFNLDLGGDSFVQSFLMGRNAEGVGRIGGNIDYDNPILDGQGRLLTRQSNRRITMHS